MNNAMFGFQLNRVRGWLYTTFGGEILNDIEERMLRLGEETIELGQVEGITREQWHGLVDQVYDKPVGERSQELGGVMVCVAAYLALTDQEGFDELVTELDRIEQPEIVEKIRTKWKQKLVVSSASERART